MKIVPRELSPVTVIFLRYGLGALLLRERLSGQQVSGIVLAGVGGLVVATNGDVLSLFTGKFGAPEVEEISSEAR